MTFNLILKPKEAAGADDLLRLNEKKQRLLALRQEGQALQQKFEAASRGKRLRLTSEIELKKAKIEQIKRCVEQLKANKTNLVGSLEAKKRSVADARKRLDVLQTKINMATQIRKGMTKNNLEMDAIRIKLMERERAAVGQLCALVFDVAPSEQLDRYADVGAFVNGTFLTKEMREIDYRIVRSWLPGDGDYEKHLAAPSVDEYGVPVETSNLANSVNHWSVLSGLALVAHFVNLLAFYTNTLLPYQLPFSIFHQDASDQDTLACAIAKLNTNVLYLSLNRGFPVANLIPQRTMENLSFFLHGISTRAPKASQRYSVAFPDRTVKLLEHMFADCKTSHLNNDCLFRLDLPIDSLDEDWEEVTSADQIPCDDAFQTSSNPAGLVTSSSTLFNGLMKMFPFYPSPTASKTSNHSFTSSQ